jgi:hypothetical protein
MSTNCRRHPTRTGTYAVVLHYLAGRTWRDAYRHAEPLEGLCDDCRVELIHWLQEEGPT